MEICKISIDCDQHIFSSKPWSLEWERHVRVLENLNTVIYPVDPHKQTWSHPEPCEHFWLPESSHKNLYNKNNNIHYDREEIIII